MPNRRQTDPNRYGLRLQLMSARPNRRQLAVLVDQILRRIRASRNTGWMSLFELRTPLAVLHSQAVLQQVLGMGRMPDGTRGAGP